MIDGDSLTMQLCVAGMAVDGDPSMARTYFARAWDARSDDYDASIAAHFVARHQPTAEDRLHWNQLAVQHAEAVPGVRTYPLLASLYLNLGDSYLAVGRTTDAPRTHHGRGRSGRAGTCGTPAPATRWLWCIRCGGPRSPSLPTCGH